MMKKEAVGHESSSEEPSEVFTGRYLRALPEGFPPPAKLFPNSVNPLEVELGCGKGKFLLARACEFPQRNFLGVDYARKWMSIGLTRGEKRRLENLRFVHSNALIVVQDYLADSSISVFHVYFPDPWPKRRHQKRRLLNASFLELLYKKLTDDGLVEIATDQEDYYRSICEEIPKAEVRWKRVRHSVNERLFDPFRKTSYELKYEREGRPLYYVELAK